MPSKARDPVAYAVAIVGRLDGAAVPKEMSAPLKTLRGAVAAYATAGKAAVDARDTANGALAKVAACDDQLDTAVDVLATALVTAGLTKRARPLAGFTTYAPSDLQKLGYANEVAEVKKVVAAVLKKKPAPAVVKAAGACAKLAAAVTAALAELVKPEAAATKALLAREACLPALVKATSKLKKQADLCWGDDDPAAFAATFAPPDAVQAPRTPVAKKAAKTKAAKKAPEGTVTESMKVKKR